MSDGIMIDLTTENSQISREPEHSIQTLKEDVIMIDSEQDTLKTPSKQPTIDSSAASSATKKKTPKQLEKEQERLEKEKLREIERQEREKAKEAERKLKEEKRIQREEEKRKRDEEKERTKKENEYKRELQKKEREEKERQKQEEKLKKEDERLKEKQKKEEERRLAEDARKKAEHEKIKKTEKLKISNFFKQKATVKSVVPVIEDRDDISDFAKNFKPFYIRAGTTLFDFHRPKGDALMDAIEKFDSEIKSSKESNLQGWFKAEKKHTHSPLTTYSATYVYENQLDNTPMNIKSIKFYENVRSWVGTYSHPIIKSIATAPFSDSSEIFIDWDDQADEDEEGEGEEISDNDEEEDEEEDEDDFDDFLEDDNNTTATKKILGPLVPIISWKSNDGKIHKIEILKENISFPINPSRDYWKSAEVKNPSPTDPTQPNTDDSPLKKKAKSLITSKGDLEKFSKEVHDSDFTVGTMIEILKKHLPSYTKVTIENTLRHLAKRVGPKATERKWEVDQDLLKQLIAE